MREKIQREKEREAVELFTKGVSMLLRCTVVSIGAGVRERHVCIEFDKKKKRKK